MMRVWMCYRMSSTHSIQRKVHDTMQYNERTRSTELNATCKSREQTSKYSTFSYVAVRSSPRRKQRLARAKRAKGGM